MHTSSFSTWIRPLRWIGAACLCLGLQSGSCQVRYRSDHDEDDDQHKLSTLRWTRAVEAPVFDPVRGARLRFEAIEGLTPLRIGRDDPWDYTERLFEANSELAGREHARVPLTLRHARRERSGMRAFEVEWIRAGYPPATWVFRFDTEGRLVFAERSLFAVGSRRAQGGLR